MLGHIDGPAWKSKRGTHRLFAWDERFNAADKTVIKYKGLEFRLGGNTPDGQPMGCISVLPPASGREWIRHPEDYVLPRLPEHIWQLIKPTENPKPLAPLSVRHDDRKIERASKYLATMEAAISGAGGHDATFRAACKLVIGFDLTTDEALHLLLTEYNPRCVPEWSEKELQHKVDEANKQSGQRGELLAVNELQTSGQFDQKSSVVNGSKVDYAKADEEASKPIDPISIGDLIEGYPTLREPIIDGLLRKGETANFIAAAKVGKSFLAGGLAWSVATGMPWLGHQVAEGRVAIIDNELHKQTLANRLYRIATDMMIDYREHQDAIDVFPIRGVGADIHHIGRALGGIEAGKYQLVILDALYRTLPDGTSENDNAAMMAIYNRLDYYATEWDCSIVVVHHASKGDQSGKSITDVGAGAGSISRAADTHLTIRPHEDPELSVLECVTRSFLSPPAKSVRFDWPLWSEVAADPVLKAHKPRSEARQEQKDAESEGAVRKVLEAADDWLAASSIRRKVGFGQTRVDRALVRLGEVVECKAIENPRNKKEQIDVYRLAKSAF